MSAVGLSHRHPLGIETPEPYPYHSIDRPDVIFLRNLLFDAPTNGFIPVIICQVNLFLSLESSGELLRPSGHSLNGQKLLRMFRRSINGNANYGISVDQRAKKSSSGASSWLSPMTKVRRFSVRTFVIWLVRLEPINRCRSPLSTSMFHSRLIVREQFIVHRHMICPKQQPHTKQNENIPSIWFLLLQRRSIGGNES